MFCALSEAKPRELTPAEVEIYLNGDPSAASEAREQNLCGRRIATLLPFQCIQSDDLIICDESTSRNGNFGAVVHGKFKNMAVAVKTCKFSDVTRVRALLEEIKILAYLGDHPCLVKFYGADIFGLEENRTLRIVTELSPLGDLNYYLQNELGKDEGQFDIMNGMKSQMALTLTLIRYCEQIANGMDHLESKKVVHGGLSTEQVLVFERDAVKIKGPRITRIKSEKLITPRRMSDPQSAWRWSAHEVLRNFDYSFKSDVWAFGVTAWEIFTLGEKPYSDSWDWSKKFLKTLEDGRRLPKPECATNDIYKMLLNCWNLDKSSRPTFNTLKEFFAAEVAKFG